jgi:hypothetical protein
MDPHSKAAIRLGIALNAVGTEGDGNNVNVVFDGNKLGNGATSVDQDTGAATIHLSSNFGSRPTDSHGNATYESAGIIAHEGLHIPQLRAFGPTSTWTEQRDWDNEVMSYDTESQVERALGNPDEGHGWEPWQDDAARIRAVIDHTKDSVSPFCAQNPACGHGDLIKRDPQ